MAIFSTIRTMLLCAASLLILLANPSLASSSLFWCNNHLLAGEILNQGQSLQYDNFRLIMQYDCNLVLYDFINAIWASGTDGAGSGCYAAMQRDGNLVVYDSNSKALWASNTEREDGNYILILQKDRNLVIYSLPIWATGTNYAGSVGVIVVVARNGTIGISGAEQNKVKNLGKNAKVI